MPTVKTTVWSSLASTLVMYFQTARLCSRSIVNVVTTSLAVKALPSVHLASRNVTSKVAPLLVHLVAIRGIHVLSDHLNIAIGMTIRS